MSAALPVLALAALILLILARIFNLTSLPEKPSVYCSDSKFLEAILKACPSLSEVYFPPLLWGRSGHLQTIIPGMFGWIRTPILVGERHSVILSDGATLTFDIFESLRHHPSSCDYTLAICPGIANSSESLYVKRFVQSARKNGYRCAVLNHIGSLSDVQLTSPRIFSYGNTDDYHQMMCYLVKKYANSMFILIGFSMGANIITKYLGEKRELPRALLCGISICQGYDATSLQPLLMQWDNLRRFYLWVMTETMKGVLQRSQNILLSAEAKLHYRLDEKKIFSAQTLVEFDEHYSRRVAGYSSLSEFYKQSSCVNCIQNITIPMLFLNAADDPVVPAELLESPKSFVGNHSKSVFVLTKHGGHLGYFEGGLMYPNTLTWLDRVLVEYTNAITVHQSLFGGLQNL